MCGACGGAHRKQAALFFLNTDPNNFLTLQILATKDSKNALFADNCTPLGHYAASSGNFLATFRHNL